jgi:hypothetical protein
MKPKVPLKMWVLYLHITLLILGLTLLSGKK